MWQTLSDPVFWAAVILVALVLLKLTSPPGRQSMLLSEINRARKAHGLPRLKRSRFLEKLAVKHSRYQANRGVCNHANVSSRYKKIQQATGACNLGENCYKYPAEKFERSVARALTDGWLKSDHHRENMLNAIFIRTGIGIVIKNGYIYATQLFSD